MGSRWRSGTGGGGGCGSRVRGHSKASVAARHRGIVVCLCWLKKCLETRAGTKRGGNETDATAVAVAEKGLFGAGGEGRNGAGRRLMM